MPSPEKHIRAFVNFLMILFYIESGQNPYFDTTIRLVCENELPDSL